MAKFDLLWNYYMPLVDYCAIFMVTNDSRRPSRAFEHLSCVSIVNFIVT